jgi:hypothetical protein
MTDQPPTRIGLFRQARGDHDEYYRLCAEHGITPDGPPTVLGPTGLPGATWPDQPDSADTAVEQLEVHHARGKQRTDEEQAALEPKYATGGVVESGVDGDNPPAWLSGCAYPPLGRGLDLLVERYGAETIARISGFGGAR